MLQERIQQQAQEESEVKSSSGTRWKSARDKGSIRSYAKDVQEKHKKKLASATTTAKVDPNTRATAAARRSARENNTSGGYANKSNYIPLYYIISYIFKNQILSILIMIF